MLPRRVRVVASVGTGVLCSLPALVHAETKPSYELSYDGAPGCPTEAAFHRAALAHVHDTSATGARIQVRIRQGDGEFRGELVATDEEGHVGRRSIQGATCKTVAQALAFLAGLAIELGGRLKSEEPPAEPPASPPLPPPAERPPARAEPPPAGGVDVSLAALGEVRTGLAPSLSPAVQVALDVESRSDGLFVPAFRGGLAGAWAEVKGETGSASLRYLAVRVEGCPLRLAGGASGASARLEFRPCLGFELGNVWAESHAPASPKDGSQLWPTGEALARLKWRISGGLFLEVNAAVGVPFVRPRYFFQPDLLLYEVPPVTARAGIGLGYRF